MHKKSKNKSWILNTVLSCILILVLLFAYQKMKQNSFQDFVKTEYFQYQSKFLRDEKNKYSQSDSYQIESENFNDAMFYKTIEVEPNTPYRVTCMIKTQDVITENEVSIAGAHISIANTVEKSRSITGTKDWQKVELIFNSKDRTTVQVGFRLGGYEDNAKGTAWFSDFKIEQGKQEKDSNWKVAFFIVENVDVMIQKDNRLQNVKIQMNSNDISDMKNNIARFASSCEELSAGKMQVEYDTYIITQALTSLSYDAENGYFIAPKNIESLIDNYVQKNNYDHIFVAVRLGDTTSKVEIPVKDWIGLGSMDYYGIGFSDIRLPNSSQSYTYKYNSSINTFPEEVFIHEFLHSLERTMKEYGYSIPALHDYEKYGYKRHQTEGLKRWYQDYMRKNIQTSSGKIGLEEIVYTLKPTKQKQFDFAFERKEVFVEPKNILEEIKALLKNATRKE